MCLCDLGLWGHGRTIYWCNLGLWGNMGKLCMYDPGLQGNLGEPVRLCDLDLLNSCESECVWEHVFYVILIYGGDTERSGPHVCELDSWLPEPCTPSVV